MDRDTKIMVLGVAMMFTGFILALLTVINVIPPLYEVMFLAYTISTLGFLVSVYSLFMKLGKRVLK